MRRVAVVARLLRLRWLLHGARAAGGSVELARVGRQRRRGGGALGVGVGFVVGSWLDEAAAKADDARKEEDKEDAAGKGKLGHEDAVVGLVKVECRGGVHLDKERGVVGSKL